MSSLEFTKESRDEDDASVRRRTDKMKTFSRVEKSSLHEETENVVMPELLGPFG